jgi:hypothetical protein
MLDNANIESRGSRPSPTAVLVNWTPNPIETVYNLFDHNKWGAKLHEWLHQAGLPQGGVPESSEKEWDFVKRLLVANWCGLLEFPSFQWQMVLPRSFHAQVRTHRHWSYFSESNQVTDPRRFADEGDYFHIPGLDADQKLVERRAMAYAQLGYREMRDAGIIHSLARGALPMHINLAMAVSTNLRSLFQTAMNRRCHVLQGTYWNPLLDQMKKEVVEKVDPRLGWIFDQQPCDIHKTCIAEIEEEPRAKGVDAHEVCPRYVALMGSEGVQTCCENGCEGCGKHARENGTKVVRHVDK